MKRIDQKVKLFIGFLNDLEFLECLTQEMDPAIRKSKDPLKKKDSGKSRYPCSQ